jgi:hypothetical protein
MSALPPKADIDRWLPNVCFGKKQTSDKNLLKFEPYADWLRLHCEVEYAVQYTGISPGPCPHCGGELEWKASVGGLGTRLETHFFQCKACDHIHTIKKK